VEDFISAILHAVLSNLGVLLVIVAIIVGYTRLRRGGTAGTSSSADVYWQELLFYGVGIGMIWFGIIHAFFQQLASKNIGWEPSPFEFELGFAEIGLGIVALLSRRSFDLRVGVTVMFAVLAFAAAAQHIYFIVCCGNMHPGNAGLTLWFGDIIFPLALVALCWKVASERR